MWYEQDAFWAEMHDLSAMHVKKNIVVPRKYVTCRCTTGSSSCGMNKMPFGLLLLVFVHLFMEIVMRCMIDLSVMHVEKMNIVVPTKYKIM